MRKHSTPGAFAKRVLSLAVAVLLSAWSTNVLAQCSIAAETSPNVVTPSGCGNGSLNLGAGAFTTISIQPNTCYAFDWFNQAADICGFCATSNGSGGSFSSNQTSWNSGSSTTLTVSSNRCGGWSGNSGLLQYRYVAPSGVSASVSPNPACIGTNISLTGSASCATSYSWTGPNGYSASTQNASRTVGAGDGGVYTLSASNNGCITTANTSSLGIISPSTAPSSISASQTTVCSGTPVNLSVVGGSLGTGAVWRWYSGSCGGTLVGTGSSQTVSPSSTTTYFVRAEGTCNNTTCAQVTINVNQPSSAAIAISGTTTICNGNSTTLTVIGGTLGTGANWQWYTSSCGGASAGSGTSITVSPASTTTYFVRAEGTCGNTACVSTTVTVNQPSVAPGSVSATFNTICNGQTTILSVNGGALGTGANWVWYAGGCGSGAPIGSGASVSVSPTSTTTYFVRAEGTCGNTSCASATITVNQLSTDPTSISGTTTICNGQSTTLSVVGGSLGTSANWQWYTSSCGGASAGSGTSITVSPTSTTTYFVRAEGICNTTSCVSVTVTVNQPSVAASSISGTTTICEGASTTLSVVGGTLGTAANWQWYSGSCGGTAVGSGPSVTVTPTATTSYFVRAEGACGNSSCVFVSVTVNDSSVSASSISGPSAICIGSSAVLSASGGHLGAGASWKWYTGSCGGTLIATGSPVTVSPAVPTTYFLRAEGTCNTTSCVQQTITINPLPNGSINGTTSICYGASATLTFNFNSGTGPFDVTYTDGTNTYTANGVNTGSTVTISPTTNTTYVFSSITDANTCNRTTGFTGGAVVTVTPLPVILSAVPTPVLCYGGNTGTITVTVNSGTPPYSYSDDFGGTFQTGNVFTGLDTGDYYVLVSDLQGCRDTFNFNPVTITQPTDITQADTVVDASCSNVFDGKITVTASGGIAPYQYSLNGGPTQSGNQFTGLGSGTYTVYVYDANSCLDTASVTINNSYNVVAVLDSQTNVSCFGGTNGAIYVQLTGGIPPYFYSINGGGYSTTNTFTGLSAGVYVINMRDSKGCNDFKTVTITQPNQLAVNIDSVINAGCFGATSGGIYISITGGTAPYTYNWSNSTTNQDVTGIGAGSYIVTVTDNNGCTTTGGATVSQPLQLTAAVASFHNLNCFNDSTGSIDISVGGGVPSYVFNWSNGKTTEDINTLGAGTYSVTITDANNCSAFLNQTITEPAQLTTTISATAIGCNGGTSNVDLSPVGGTTPYNYFWNNGSVTQDLTGVGPGTYTVLVTDAHACTAVNSVTVSQPTAIALLFEAAHVLCFGNTDGAVDLVVTGGTGSYTYNWSNGATSEDISGLAAGTYDVTVTDGNGCTATGSVDVNQPAQALNATFTSTDVTCNGANNGSINLTVTGGTQPYAYNWSNGATTEDLTGLGPNTYDYTVTDDNGCQAFGSVVINEPAALSATIAGTNVTCNGGNDGAADLTVTGGNGGYTYLWSTFANTQDISGLTAGNYTVIVTDSKGCQTFASVTISQNPAMTLSGVVTNVACNGGTTGAIDITAGGGASPLSYLWSNSSTNEDQSGLAAGSYSVTVTDNNGCSVSGTFTITQPSALNLSIASVGNVNCHGGSNGFVNVTISGGVTSYSYAWSNGATSQNLVNVTAGAYTLTVTDANGCTAEVSQSITEPDTLTASIAAGSINCNGGTTNVDLTVIGGTANYSYFWNSGATSEDLTGVGPGTYTVLVTDAKGCTATATTTITQPSAVTVSGVVTNVSCNGGANGAIDITATGGAGSYTYNWSNSSTNEDQSGLTAGTYTVTVNDGSSCSASASFTISQPANALTSNAVATNVSCNGAGNGSIDLTVSGGTPAYTYAWSNGATTQDISGLSAGTFTVTIIDANGCTDITGATVTEPAALSATIAGTDATCFGGNDGSADLTVSGGNAPYNYFWSTFEFTEDITGLSAGNYVVIVTDSKSCQTYATVTISQPAPVSITGTAFNLTCNGSGDGLIDITVTGGNGIYAYQWSNGATAQDINGLSAGTYTVTVLDGNLCSGTASFTITEPAAIVITAAVTNVNCNGNANGAVDITVTGGTSPYTYDWSTGSTTQDVSGLSGGLVSVVVTDANLCSALGSYTITEPSAITTSISVTDVSCFGSNNGALDLTVNGGVAPYSYLWSTFNTTQDLSGLGGGTYFVIVTDANGCQKTDSAVINEAPKLVLSVAVTNVSCNGGTGSVDLTVSGGAPGYNYSWSNSAITEDLAAVAAGTYTVTVTDAANCSASISATVTQPTAINATIASFSNVSCNGANNGSINISVSGGVTPYTYGWSSGSTLEDLVNIGAGTYTVTITDANSCTATLSQTITEPALLTASTTATTILCNGGTADVDLTVNGGTPNYSYFWNNGAITQDLTGVSAGSYSVIVTDANGCTANSSITITQPAALALSVSVTNASCNGGNGSVDLTVSGGTAAYSFSWSNGATTEDIASVAAGTYTVTVTDANNCTATASATVTQPTALVLTAQSVNVNCNGGNNGSINISVSGGVQPYSYDWGGGVTVEDRFNLTAGTYNVLVTDANGCTITGSYTITEPSAITSSVSSTDVTCAGAHNGTATLTVNGGTAPYTFNWSNFQVSQNLSNLSGGTYYVSITDANGCTRRDSTIINEPTAIVLSTVVTNIGCNGGLSGSIDLTVSGGTPGYTYVWSNSAVTQDLSGVGQGTYTVTVTDAGSCTATTSATITQPNALVLSATVQSVSCAGLGDGSINLTVSGGVTPYSFAWSNTSTTEDLINLTAGTYTVTVTDNNTCSASASYSVTEPTPIVSSVVSTNVLCQGANNGTADLTVSGGVLPYTILWSNFQGSEDIQNLDGGIYYVLITDANGCIHRDSVIIQEPSPLILSTLVTNITCFNANNGSIDLTVQGGTSNYSYAWSSGPTTQDLSNLPGGNYVVTVTDANGCTAVTSAIIANPSAITANFILHNPLCFGSSDGSVDMIPTGGTPPYTFNWSTGANTEDLFAVDSGVYFITITDSKGCVKTDSVTITEPNPLVTSGFIKNVSCNGSHDGFIDITGYGGTLPYTFSWSTNQSTEDIGSLPGGNYFVTVTDINNCQVASLYIVDEPAPLTLNLIGTNLSCNGSGNGTVSAIPGGGVTPYQYLWEDFHTDSSRSGLAAGYYALMLTDSNGCFVIDSIILTEPLAISISGTVTNANCFGAATGAIDISVIGGSGTYTYAWSNGATTEDLANIVAGVYSVTAIDANGCLGSATFTVTQPLAISLSTIYNNPGCYGANNGSVSVIAVQGVAPYSYAWNTNPLQTTASAQNLQGGVYDVTVTDANGCTASATQTLTQPDSIAVSTATTGAKCFNTASGQVVATVTGGQAPLVYELNGIAQPGNTFTNLMPGNYTILVSDANGCEGTTSFTIADASQIAVTITTSEQVIATGMQTQLVATAISTSPIENYIWSPSNLVDFSVCGGDSLHCNNPFVQPPTTTFFTVTVMNQDSCFASDTITIYVSAEANRFIPTAFTPNGDGLNDRFELDILGANSLEVSIFNRWGERFFYDASQPNGISGTHGWDGMVKGKQAPEDTYVYKIKVTYFDSTTREIEGTITLMR
ncbi:MAG: gliding motility-associated C-terminal domain-containing protein [Chitinophagales bacterium]